PKPTVVICRLTWHRRRPHFGPVRGKPEYDSRRWLFRRACRQTTEALMDVEILPADTDTAAVRPARLAGHQEADHRVANSLQLVIALLARKSTRLNSSHVKTSYAVF